MNIILEKVSGWNIIFRAIIFGDLKDRSGVPRMRLSCNNKFGGWWPGKLRN